MAIVVKEKSTLQEQAKDEWIKLGIIWAVALLTFVVPLIFSGNPFIYLLPVIAISIAGNLSWKALIIIRGNLGERRVFNLLRELPNDYYILNDITIKVDGKEAQIDHLLFSPYGIWSIETKSHLGWIYGKEKDRNWTQKKKSEKGRIHTKSFYNPISQNAVHCNRLSDYLFQKAGVRLPIKSIVVFTSADKLNVESTTPVVSLKKVKETIRNMDTTPTLSQDNVKKLIKLVG